MSDHQHFWSAWWLQRKGSRTRAVRRCFYCGETEVKP